MNKSFLNKNNVLIVPMEPSKEQIDWLAFRWGHVRDYEENFDKPLQEFKNLPPNTTQLFVMCMAAEGWNVEKAIFRLNEFGINDANAIAAAQKDLGLCDNNNLLDGKAVKITMPCFIAVDLVANSKKLLEDAIKKCPDFLKKVDLRCSNMPNTILRRADLTETDFEGANLKGADLREANLEKAVLWKAKMVFARIGRGIVNSKTNFTGVNLSGVTNLPWNPEVNRFGYVFARGVDRTTRQQMYGEDKLIGGLSNILEAGNNVLKAFGLNR
jgi:hypothetical protein